MNGARGDRTRLELLLAAAQIEEYEKFASDIDGARESRPPGITPRREGDEKGETDLEEEFDPGTYITDTHWLAVVMLCLSDDLGKAEALALVDRNRRPCLDARAEGAEPWEVARFMAEQVGARARPEAAAPPSRQRGSRQKRDRKRHRKKHR